MALFDFLIHQGVVTAFGNSLEELKENLKIAFDDYMEVAEEEKWVTDVTKMTGWSIR